MEQAGGGHAPPTGQRPMSAQATQGWQRLLHAAQREALARREQRQLQMSMVLDEGGAAGAQGGAQAADGGSLSVAGSAVPAALADSSNIPDYLATAQELEARDPAVADLVLRAALAKAKKLDPDMKGRGMLQFVTALTALTSRVTGAHASSSEEIHQEMELVYRRYQEYEQEVARLERSGNRLKLGRVLKSAKVLVEVYESVQATLPPGAVPRSPTARQAHQDVPIPLQDAAHAEDMRKTVQKTEVFTKLNYNIIPPPGHPEDLTNPPQWRRRELLVQRALEGNLRHLLSPETFSKRPFADIFELLGFIFCFQKDNLDNQREHLVLLVANQRIAGPEEQFVEKAVAAVSEKVLENYTKWADYLHVDQDHMKGSHTLVNTALYLLIWGEAANVRFLPECLCYLFHQMSRELQAILSSGLRRSAATKYGVKHEFLDNVISPIYVTLKNEVDYAYSGQGKPKGHPAWRNYDDMNEFFWTERCFKLGWPLDLSHPFFVSHDGKVPPEPTAPHQVKTATSAQEREQAASEPLTKAGKKRRRRWLGKSFFVEWRSFLHLYHSFNRVWAFLLLMLQAMLILAFSGPSGLNTLIKMLSIFPAAACYQFLEVTLDLLFSIGAYKSLTIGMLTAKLARFTLSLAWGGALSFFCIKVFQGQLSTSGPYFPVYMILLAAYVLPRLCIFLLLCVTPYRKWASRVGNNKFVQFVKIFYQDQVFVGRGMFESSTNTFWYTLFWVVLLISKFLFSYYMQILPMVGPTRYISSFSHLQYKWHDVVSASHYNLLSLVALWAPVITIYFVDLQIWYTILSSLVGTAVGAWWHLGEIRSLRILRARFRNIPEAFNSKLQFQTNFQQLRSNSKTREQMATATDPGAAQLLRVPSLRTNSRRFAQAWNEIVALLRDEDLLSNKERDLLLMPPGNPSLSVAQWPLFLLANQILLAVEAAASNKDSTNVLWERIASDEYRRCAVLEAFQTLQALLLDMLSTDQAAAWHKRYNVEIPEKRIVQHIFRDLHDAVQQGVLVTQFSLKSLPRVLQELTKLTAILSEDSADDGIDQVRAVQALQGLYDCICRDFFTSPDYRFSLESIQNLPPDYRLFSSLRWPSRPAQAQRLHLLLTMKDSAGEIPGNLEARRRLEFFTNSLFMRMPTPPLVVDCVPFCVMTPYYSETVTYSMKQLAKPNEDGISDLYYLQKIFPDEFSNLLERIGMSQKEMNLKLKADEDVVELRAWASYRGQTLARTVRGMMYYHRALRLLSSMESGSPADVEMGADGRTSDPLEARAFLGKSEHKELADRKFTYVVTCQIYGQQKSSKDERAMQIFDLMKENEALRVAYIDEKEEQGPGKGKTYYSCLAKVDSYGNEQCIYRIKLPGNAKLGEGKPENQNHAIVFTRGEALQTIDMNQDNYFEETLKMRNLLEELRIVRGVRKPTILGVREHIFTGSVSSLAWFMSNQEASFVTLGQRTLAIPLKVRMHYGHPDVFDRLFAITRGGVSKASRTINISEDIFTGFNTTLRNGNVTHHEYIQVGKGRDVGLNQIAVFEGKVAGGNGEQVLSRDVYRLGCGFDFFRMLSFFYTSVGFYLCTLLTVWAAFFFLYGKVYLALSGVEATLTASANVTGNQALQNAINTQFLIQLGFFSAVPMLLGFILEKGVLKAIMDFIVMQLQLASVFFTFSLGTRAHYFVRTLLHGGASYHATGRGFVVKHIKFADNYRLYSRSHFTLGLEAIMLLIVYMVYGSNGGSTLYILITVSSWFLALSWCFAPFIFNPAGFDWQKTVADFEDWTAWLWYSGGVGLKGDQSWEAWWEKETDHVYTLRSRMFQFVLNLRFFFIPYGMIYWMHVTNGNTSPVVYGIYWIVVAAVLLLLSVFNWSRGIEAQLVVRLVQLLVFLAAVVALLLGLFLTRLTVSDVFVFILALIPTGWGMLQLAVAFRPSKNSRQWWWRQVRSMARLYDGAMGALLFFPVAVLSWFPIISTFQTRLMFNQAFSRGLEISLLLENKPSQD